MERDRIIPVLYDLAVTIGGEVSLKPLLTRFLQRLLYFTSFPAGFICLDLPEFDGLAETAMARLDASVGEYALSRSIGGILPLPARLLYGDANRTDSVEPDPIEFAGSNAKYAAHLRLPFDGRSVIVLLAPKLPETDFPLNRVFQPILAHLSRAIMLCRRNDAHIQGLKVERDLFSKVFDCSNAGILVTDGSGRIADVNPAFTRITGYGLEEVHGRTPHLLTASKEESLRYWEIQHAVLSVGHWHGEILFRRKNGEEYAVWLNATPVREGNGSTANYVGIFSDIGEQKAAERKITRLAYFDPVTDLPNRKMLQERLPGAVESSASTGRYGAVLFLDLDDFKILNDTRGHAVGDLLLVEVARRIRSCVRERDIAARIGGDEFVVVMESMGATRPDAVERAERIAEKLRMVLEEPYTLLEHLHRITASIGASLFRGNRTSAGELLKQAEIAMYQAKRAGRNEIRFFEPYMQTIRDERARMESELRQALAEDQFVLYYQAQVDEVGRTRGAETLIRWIHPVRGLVPPSEFIPVAEDAGLIGRIGDWVLRSGCARLAEWQESVATRHLVLSMNVSAKQMRAPDFVDRVKIMIAENGIPPGCVKLELTESAILEDVDGTIGKMRELRRFGIGFAIDDFGTGYSSLQYLQRLPLDELKIDQSFVRGLGEDSSSAAIVRAIIAMAKALGLETIAEGVETSTQREFLRTNGCRNYQGYYFGKPVPIEEFEGALRAGTVRERSASLLPV